MRRAFITFLVGVLASLALAVTASAATVPVTQLSGDFAITNPTVTKVADGVQFGSYVAPSIQGGSLIYKGANGVTLSALSALSYSAQFHADIDGNSQTPYLTIFLSRADPLGGPSTVHRIQYFAGDQPGCTPATNSCPETREDTMITHDVASSLVRYDGGAPATFASTKAAHLGETVTSMTITTGTEPAATGIPAPPGGVGGAGLSALLRDWTVNGNTFAFNVPPPAGSPGVPGNPGASGPSTVVTQVPTTVVVQRPGTATGGTTCKGATRRIFHAPRHPGERFLGARAALLSRNGRVQSLPVSGRTISLDLTGKPAGNYNVRIKARYRSNRSGRVRTRTTTRNFSVACS